MRNLIRAAVMFVAIFGVQPAPTWASSFNISAINVDTNDGSGGIGEITIFGSGASAGINFHHTLKGFKFSLVIDDFSVDFRTPLPSVPPGSNFLPNPERFDCTFATCWSAGVNYIASQEKGAVFVAGPDPLGLGSPSIELPFDTSSGNLRFEDFVRNACPQNDCALPTPNANNSSFGSPVPLPAPLWLFAGGIAAIAMFSRLRKPVVQSRAHTENPR